MPSSKHTSASNHSGPNSVVTVNVLLLVVTIVGIGCAIPAGYFWHKFQMRRISSALLARADVGAAKSDWQSASDYVYRYLQVHPEDNDARCRLAELYDKSAKAPAGRTRAIALYYQAIGVASETKKIELRRRVAELLLKNGRLTEAEQEARQLLALNAKDPQALRLRALSLFGQFQLGKLGADQEPGSSVGEAFELAVAEQPGDVELAATLAFILRDKPGLLSVNQTKTLPTNKERDAKADAIMDQLVAQEPTNEKKLLARYQYRTRYNLAGAMDDLDQALRNNDADADVAITAARHYHQAAASLHTQRGLVGEVHRLGEIAATHYRRVVEKLDSKSIVAYLGLSEILQLLNDLPAAIAVTQKGMEQVGDDQPMLCLRLVDQYLASNQLPEAESAIQRFDEIRRRSGRFATDPQWIAAGQRRMLLEATLYAKRGKPFRAIQAALPITSNGQTTAGERIAAWLIVGNSYAALNDWDQAALSYESAIALDPRNDAARQAVTNAWIRAGQPARAARHLETSLNHERSVSSAIQLANAWLEFQALTPAPQRDWKRADELLARISAAKTDEILDTWRITLLQSDFAALRAGDAQAGAEQALSYLTAAEKQFPNSAPLWRELVVRYERLKKPADADRALAECLRIEGQEPAVHLLASRIYLGRSDFDKARKVLEDALPQAKKDVQVSYRSALAGVGLAEGKLDRAQRDLEEILKIDPLNFKATYQLAELGQLSNNSAEAKRWEEKLRELEGPNGAHWRYLQVRSAIAEMADDSKNPTPHGPQLDRVLQLQDELQTLRPSWWAVHSLRGNLEDLRGNDKAAAESYQTAVRLGDHRVATYERLVTVLFRQKRFVEANEYLARLKDFVSNSSTLSPMAVSIAAGLDDLPQAQLLAKKAIETRPNDPMAWLSYGRVFQLNQQSSDVEHAFRKAIELAPNDLRTWVSLFSYQLRSGKPDQAKETLHELAKVEKIPETDRALAMAVGYEMMGDMNQADAEYASATKKWPESLPVWMQYSNFLMKTEFQRAEVPLRQIVQLASANETTRPLAENARRALATVLASRGGEAGFTEAMTLLQQGGNQPAELDQRLQALILVKGPSPDLPRAQQLLEDLIITRKLGTDGDAMLLAEVYARQAEKLSGDARKAKLAAVRKQLDSLCVRPKPQASHLQMYVDFLLSQADWPEADRYLQRLESLAGNDARVLFLRIRWLKLQQRVEEISPLVEKYAARMENELTELGEKAQLYANVGDIYLAVGLTVPADTWFRKLRALDPNRYAALARSLLEQGKKDEAIQICREEAEKENTPDRAILLAYVLTESHADPAVLRSCEPLLDKILSQHSDHHGLQLALANLWIFNNQSDKAAAMYRAVLQKDPKNAVALNNLANAIAESSGNSQEALRYVDEAIRLGGSVPAFLDTKGLIYLYNNRPADAIPHLQQAAELSRTDPRMQFHLAYALLRVGKKPESREAFAVAERMKLRRQLLTKLEQQMLADLDVALQGVN